MTMYLSVVYPPRKHMKYSEKLMMAYALPIIQVLSSSTDFTGLVIIGRQWLHEVHYVKRCKACEIYADFIHQPPELLLPTIASWPFEVWGIDVTGPISLLSTRAHRFILAIIDYFSKWAKVIPLAEVKIINVVNFLKHHVIHRFGVPRRIIHDNGPQFVSQLFFQFCDKYRIQNVASTAYNPTVNGLAEAFNKTY